MRFINIVLLVLCTIAGSAFALPPSLFLEVDERVDQNPEPIIGDCLQGDMDFQEPELEAKPKVSTLGLKTSINY
jgi:hypothetical protein